MTRRQHVLLLLAVLLGPVLQSDYSGRMAWEQGTPFYNLGVKPVQALTLGGHPKH